MPGVDHQAIARIIETGQHHITDVDPEAGPLSRRVRSVDRHAPSTDLGLTRPTAGMAFGRVVSGTVQGEPRVALKVVQFARSWHHPEVDLAVPEFDLDAADPRGAVLAKGRQRLVFPDGEPLGDLAGEWRLGRGELGPAGQHP